MASSILNFVFDNYLSEIVEIDTSKTNFSLISGQLEISNLKIKDEIFQKLDLPFMEVAHGFIGEIKINLQMPFFYEHQIKVIINKIFFHARLKSINKLNKEDEIKNMQKLKETRLLSAEQIFAQVLDVKKQNEEKKQKEEKQGPGLIQKIINNLYVEVTDIVFRLDDEISFPVIPYSIGVILETIQIRSTRSDYKIPKNSEEVIPYQEINYKVVLIDNFSIYMDCFDLKEELDYEKLIDNNALRKDDSELRNHLRDQYSFYSYCRSEVYVHSKKFEAHQYILHQLDLSVKVAINDNVNNQQPKLKALIDFPQILLGISLKQIKTLLKLKAYWDLGNLYQGGIAKEFYDKELTQNEKNQYIENYLNYFHKKYIDKQSIEYPSSLINTEERLNYDQIAEMRNVALKKLEYIVKIDEISGKIRREENNIFGRRNDVILKLNDEKKRILKLEEQFLKTGKAEPIEDTTANEQDELKNVDNNYTKIYAKIDILVFSFTIYETVKKNEVQKKIRWEIEEKLLSIGFKDLGVEAKIQKVGIIAFVHLNNIIISQDKEKNPNYNKIFFGDLTVNDNLICIFFEMNPTFQKSDIRVKVISERNVYIIADIYNILYIKEQIMGVLSTGIDLEEVGSYVKEGIFNYIKEGYNERLVEGKSDENIKFTHTNLYLDVNLKPPKIIVPIDIFDHNNHKCITMSLGEINVKTILPPRVDNNIDYKRTENEHILYDIYRVGINGIGMSTDDNCIEKNNYEGNNKKPLLKKFNISVEAKLLIQPKNIHKKFNNMIINVIIDDIIFNLNEFQILLLIKFLANMTNSQNILEHQKKLRISTERHKKEIENKKNLEHLSEEAQKAKKKEELEKEREKNEKMKKAREDDNIKKAKVVYGKVIKSFSMSDRSIAKYETEKAKREKKSILVNLVIKKFEFNIQKNITDLITQDYLHFEIEMIKVEVDIMLNGIIFVCLLIQKICLSDLDKDMNKVLYLNKEYQFLIKSPKIGNIVNNGIIQESKNCFIDLNLLMLGDEMDIFINMNELQIMISLDTITRLYQFGMHYYGVFATEKYYVEIKKYQMKKKYFDTVRKHGGRELEEKQKSEKEQLNKEYMARLKKYVSNIYTEEKAKEDIKKTHKIKNLNNYVEEFAERVSSRRRKKVSVFHERNRSKMRIIFNMNDTMFIMLLDHKDLNEPSLSMNFNMTFSMDAYNVFDNIMIYPSRMLLAQIYETKTSFMHISLSKFEFDMVNYKPKAKTFIKNSPSERFISDFRLKCSIESYIQPFIEESVMTINVILEPLILAFGMRQVRKLMGFLPAVTAFSPKLQEKYVPQAPTDQKGNYSVNKIPKEKSNIKDKFRQVLVRNQLEKILRQIMKNTKTKKHEIFINTTKFNSKTGIECKIDKISLVLFDNTQASRTVMLQVNMTKLLVKMILNSRLRDKENMNLALYEILTGGVIPRTNFNINKLAMYLDLVFSIDVNYHNIIINDFEPLLERFNMGVTILQVAPFCKMKGFVTTNDVINFNLSTDSVIALNKFLVSFMQDEKMWEIFKRRGTNFNKLYEPMRNSINEQNNNLKEEQEIILKFINLTGINLVFSFDDNPNYKIPLQPNGRELYTRKRLHQTRGHDRHRNPYQKTTFSLHIGDCKPIENINFQRNNYRQFKASLQNNMGKRYPIYFGIKVESIGITNIVTFCPSLSFYNNTKFENIFLNINNPNIAEKTTIKIQKEDREYIPLTWLMCDPPDSTISIKLSENGQYTPICNNISEFFIQPIIDPIILNERETLKKQAKKEFPDANNPTFKKMLDIKTAEFNNRKDSKTLVINDKGVNKTICLDYFLIHSQDIKKLKEKARNSLDQEPIMTEHNIPLDTNTSMTELIPTNNQSIEYDYEYMVYVRPSIKIINKIPFPINITYQNGNKHLETLENETFYSNDISNMTFTMEYNNNIYTSQPFSLNQENLYIDLISNNSAIPLKCHIFRNPINIELPSPQKFFCHIQDFSIASYEYIFFFDYLFNNKLTKKLWIRPCEPKGITKLTPIEINQNVFELNPTSISLLSFPDYEKNSDCVIKDENSPWSEPFNMNTIGVQGVVKLNSTNYPVAQGTINTSQYNQNLNFQATNEVACLLRESDIYDFSVIIVFEPKYIIINNLGFDVVYRQENCTNIYPLRIKNHQGMIYEKGNKDFRIGIKDDFSGVYNFSGIFNLENEMDVDIKIKIDKNNKKYNDKEMRIFSYDGREYYILVRVINQSYDQGTVFILLTHPIFPYFEIANYTHAPLRIYEEGSSGITICNWKEAIVPFVWENSNKHGDKIFFEIYGKSGTFNYSRFKEESIEIKERATTILYGVSSKNKTITRRFEMKLREELSDLDQDELKMYFRGKSRPKSMFFDIFIRGFGISIIDNTPQEVFYISLYNLKVNFLQNVLISNKGAQTDTTMNVELFIDNLQIDYCLNDSLRVVLAPKEQLVPSVEAEMRMKAKNEGREVVPFIQVLLTMSTKVNNFKEEKVSSYDQIDFIMQEFDIKVEQYALMNVLKIVLEMVGAFDLANKIKVKEDKEPLLDVKTHIPLKKLLNENENSVLQLVYYLLVGALKFNLTLRLDLSSIPLGLPKTAKRVIGTIGNTLGRITDCPLRFSEKVVENVYLSWADIAMLIIKPYITEGITQVYKVLGSLDIIGNPVKFVRNVGGGFYDFVNEPRKGFKIGPKEFGIGVAKGVGNVFYGVIGGIFDVIQRISGTLYAATQSLTGHDRESMSIEDENEPSNILSGFAEGFAGFGKEIGKGFYGFCYEPCQKSKTGGTAGLCKGLGTGLLKLVISPFAGLLKLITCIFAGFKNTCYYLTGKKKIKTSRFRHPRVIVEGDKKLMPYEDNKAEAREVLYQLENIDTNNILFAGDFICPECPRRMSTAILTDNHMYVVYDNRKIIFKLNTAKADNAFIHFIDNKFYLVFKMNDNTKKGFPIHYDYSTIATNIHDILHHKYNKAAIMFSDGKQGQLINYNDLTVDGLFDKSSYANTLIGAQSVYSDKTLISKLTVRNTINNNNKDNITNTIHENESVQQLYPKSKKSGYVALNVK